MHISINNKLKMYDAPFIHKFKTHYNGTLGTIEGFIFYSFCITWDWSTIPDEEQSVTQGLGQYKNNNNQFAINNENNTASETTRLILIQIQP